MAQPRPKIPSFTCLLEYHRYYKPIKFHLDVDLKNKTLAYRSLYRYIHSSRSNLSPNYLSLKIQQFRNKCNDSKLDDYNNQVIYLRRFLYKLAPSFSHIYRSLRESSSPPVISSSKKAKPSYNIIQPQKFVSLPQNRHRESSHLPLSAVHYHTRNDVLDRRDVQDQEVAIKGEKRHSNRHDSTMETYCV